MEYEIDNQYQLVITISRYLIVVDNYYQIVLILNLYMNITFKYEIARGRFPHIHGHRKFSVILFKQKRKK